MARKRNTKTKKKSSGIVRFIGRLIFWFFVISLLWVIALRFINPPVTLLILIRGFEQKADDKEWKMDQKWLSFEELPLTLKTAAIAGEDANFLEHNGFDFEAIEKAYKKNKSGKKKSGGSTISQQTAKNVFLWPGRSYIRKGFEVYFTALIEILWSKERILEVYLNVIEMGDGIYGAESASQKYFHKPAAKLTKGQAALIVAVLPNPLRWNPAKPTPYIYRRQYLIMRNMRRVTPLKF